MASSAIESAASRIKRSRTHLDSINAHITDYIRSTKDDFVIKVNPQLNSVYLVWWTEANYWLSFDTSVIIGEFLYNLRSLLDNLVCALVRVSDPDSDCAGRQFPIHSDGPKFNASAKDVLKGVPDAGLRLIRDLQPYQRGNGAKLDPLNILNALCNRDKHRALQIVAGYHRDAQFRISRPDGRPVLYFGLPRSAFMDGPKVVDLPLTPSEVDGELKVEAGGTKTVCFLEPGPWGERPVNEVLVACLDYVEKRVVPRFKPLLDQGIDPDRGPSNFSPD